MYSSFHLHSDLFPKSFCKYCNEIKLPNRDICQKHFNERQAELHKTKYQKHSKFGWGIGQHLDIHTSSDLFNFIYRESMPEDLPEL